MKIKIVIITLVVLLLNTLLFSEIEDKNINVIFRVDDYGIDSEDFYKKLFATFHDERLPLVVGVVPFSIVQGSNDIETIQPMSERAVNILKAGLQTCDLEVGQHGYCHDNILNERKLYSEFVGLDYDTQYSKIVKGKNFLEETFPIQVTTFIPPWNSYDKTTLKVLDDLNYECISSSCDKRDVIKDISIKYIPYTVDLSNLKDAVLQANKSDSYLPHIIVVLFHAYDFYENQDYYEENYTYNDNLSEKAFIYYHEFEELLHWINDQDDIKVTTFRDIIQTEIDLGWERFAENRSLKKLLPAPGFVYPNYYSYSTFNDIPRNVYQVMYTVNPLIFYTVLLIISIVLGYVLTYLLKRNHQKYFKTIYSILTILFVILLVYSLRDLQVGYRALMLLTTFIGLNIGYFIHFHDKNQT